MTDACRPSLGAIPTAAGVRFRVWAPEAARLEAVVETAGRPPCSHPMTRAEGGYFDVVIAEARDGDLYRYRVDGRGPFPDPVSRFQPLGVHGPSQVVDWRGFDWADRGWTGLALEDTVLYELHVGTFTPEGTFASAAARLPDLVDLGVTAIELMPVADFPGRRNWGYDGVATFAPARCYGTPDDLRRLVDAAHRLGLAVHLDVVYNHLGPDGATHLEFSRHYMSASRTSPWGAAINFDGPSSEAVRALVVENACCWVREYHVDGLRLDATHAIADDSRRHILAEVASAARRTAESVGRRVLVVAEDVRNLAQAVEPEPGGWGLDALWSDDFHHQVRRLLAGDADGYFVDFEGTTAGVAATARRGWYYCGQHAAYFGGPRGTNPDSVPLPRFVFFIQNHDQVGNRALGDRMHHALDAASWRAVSAMWLLLPETPLLFMGQEWAARSPFLYFTDHEPGLGRLVTEGRRREFGQFAAFADGAAQESIPDPQDDETFHHSRLDWDERTREPHASVLALYRRLLALRRTEPALVERSRGAFRIEALNADTIVVRRDAAGGEAVLAVIRLRGAGRDAAGATGLAEPPAGTRWETLLTTEDAGFAPDPCPATVDSARPAVIFGRPGAVVFRAAAGAVEGTH